MKAAVVMRSPHQGAHRIRLTTCASGQGIVELPSIAANGCAGRPTGYWAWRRHFYGGAPRPGQISPEQPGRTGDAFDPLRTGLDHVAFEVVDCAQLDSWIARLDHLAVSHSPVRELGHSSYCVSAEP